MSKKKLRISHTITEHFPECLNTTDVKVIMIGNHELLIENYCGIGEYLEQKIVVRGRNRKLIIEGDNLLIEYYSKYDLKISGILHSLRWNS